MSYALFEPTRIAGPFDRRVRPKRTWLDNLPWDEALPQDDASLRWVWTQTAFSEYAAAAGFAAIASALLAASAPLDLICVASDFVSDELVHVEAAARLVTALGGAVPLEVDFERLVRRADAQEAKLRAAELIIRTSCVGEVLSVPILKRSRSQCGSNLVDDVIRHVLADEVAHARFGHWFLDWAESWLDDASRAHLGRVAGAAVRSFAPLLTGGCERARLGVLSCDEYDKTFLRAVQERIVKPLGERGIVIPATDLTPLTERA